MLAQTHKRLIANFIKWAEGLEQKSAVQQRLVVCLATNIKEDLDSAIRDRVRISVAFDLPSEPQRTDWWAQHARQLTALGEHARLGRLSVGLSYRNLWRGSDCAA